MKNDGSRSIKQLVSNGEQVLKNESSATNSTHSESEVYRLVQELEIHRIELIITDIQMPEMNGYEAVKQIRQLNDKVIIIAMTDFAQTGEKEIAQEAGCNDYVSKPIKKDQLMGLMQKYFTIPKY